MNVNERYHKVKMKFHILIPIQLTRSFDALCIGVDPPTRLAFTQSLRTCLEGMPVEKQRVSMGLLK
ncbi:hypothetical protein H5410_063360 [Solanum commersonii]|uniref:Uncharacterized protein n=1 Tax=Solanum commersonii TaxID=4109 RepID=A0A9J5WDB0_SOLCO|nr:hypothetical protein H5410_063360 [Solanum commersonii]